MDESYDGGMENLRSNKNVRLAVIGILLLVAIFLYFNI